MTELPGIERHPHARAVLGAALREPLSPSHAYLFHGPPGSGRRAVARAFAAELLADGAPDPDAVRGRVGRGSHPDLTWVAPSGAHEMLVADIEGPVVAAAARTPFEANRRVFVIDRADALNDQAANRLLKTLEEPASTVHLVLVTAHLGEVLPTIVSRCQLVRFDPPPPAVLQDALASHGIGPDQAHACARLALGDGERALSLALGEGPALRVDAEGFARAALRGEIGAARPWRGLLERAKAARLEVEGQVEAQRDDLLQTAARTEKSRITNDYAERAKRAGRRAERETLDLGLQLTGLWYRDLAACAWGAQDLVHHSDRADALQADAQGADPQRLRRAVELVDDTRFRLALNVGEELACEALGYRLEALLAR